MKSMLININGINTNMATDIDEYTKQFIKRKIAEEKSFKRLETLFSLWWAGMPTLILIGLLLLGAKTFYELFSQAYALYLILLGLLILPILISLFILNKAPEEEND